MPALTDDRLAQLLAYCRIDDPDEADKALLQVLYDAAVGYMETAGVSEPEAGTARRAQYDLCINHQVLTAYDQRGEAQEGTTIAENPAYRRMLNQLKLSEAPLEGAFGEV